MLSKKTRIMNYMLQQTTYNDGERVQRLNTLILVLIRYRHIDA